MAQGMFSSADAFKAFALAGNAVFTVVSKKTGARFTYRIRQGEGDKAPHFVSVLVGPDNTTSYKFFATIFGRDFKTMRMGARSKIGRDAPSVNALFWLFAHLDLHSAPFELVEIWHQGKCGKCRKPLTVPSSIESGLGPVCAKSGK